jgi:hypothetical protein
MGRVILSRVTEVPGWNFIETTPAPSFSSSELLARLRVPKWGGEGGALWDSTRVDLGRYLGRADVLSRGRGRNVDRLVGTAGLSGVLAFAREAKDAGGTVSLRVDRLREVRVIVSPGEKASSLARGRSPMELRRSSLLFVRTEAALRVLSLGFLAARIREGSLVSLFMASERALPKAFRE